MDFVQVQPHPVCVHMASLTPEVSLSPFAVGRKRVLQGGWVRRSQAVHTGALGVVLREKFPIWGLILSPVTQNLKGSAHRRAASPFKAPAMSPAQGHRPHPQHHAPVCVESPLCLGEPWGWRQLGHQPECRWDPRSQTSLLTGLEKVTVLKIFFLSVSSSVTR